MGAHLEPGLDVARQEQQHARGIGRDNVDCLQGCGLRVRTRAILVGRGRRGQAVIADDNIQALMLAMSGEQRLV